MSHDKLIQIIAGAVMVVLLAGSGVVGTTITESSGHFSVSTTYLPRVDYSIFRV